VIPLRFGTIVWRALAFGPALVALWLLAASVARTAPTSQPEMPLPERIQQCAGCHGEDGNSKMEKIPSLAGQPEFFMQNQLVLMREGVRPIEAMAPFVKGLTDGEIVALAKHFAALEPKPSDEPVDANLVNRGAEVAGRLRCGSCHLPTLAGQQQMPRVAKQRIDYTFETLKAFRDDRRSGADTLMSAAVYGASDADLLALAHYAASR
jgi:cytochrome c553